MWISLALSVFSGLTITNINGAYLPVTKDKCEPIHAGICKFMPYNYTNMHLMTQKEAAFEIQIVNAMVGSTCSDLLPFFLCSVYFPMCSKTSHLSLTVCRSVCEAVKSQCVSSIQEIGFHWPKFLNCDQFPVGGDIGLCFKGNTPEQLHKAVLDWMHIFDFLDYSIVCEKLRKVRGINLEEYCKD